MHTQGKWILSRTGGDISIFCKNEMLLEVFGVNGEANAKRIVQMNTSFDGLLEALKEGLEWIYPMTDTLVEEKERENVIKRIQQAIAQAEE